MKILTTSLICAIACTSHACSQAVQNPQAQSTVDSKKTATNATKQASALQLTTVKELINVLGFPPDFDPESSEGPPAVTEAFERYRLAIEDALQRAKPEEREKLTLRLAQMLDVIVGLLPTLKTQASVAQFQKDGGAEFLLDFVIRGKVKLSLAGLNNLKASQLVPWRARRTPTSPVP